MAAVPTNFKLAYSAELLRNRIQQLGKSISSWAVEVEKQTGNQLLCVCILRGGIHFFSDLTRAIPHSVELTTCRTWSYSPLTNDQQSSVRVDVETVAADGRAILLLDDICDTGATLRKLKHVLLELGAKEVRSAVLIRRLVEKPIIVPDWSCFEYQGEEWFVGYGMDDRSKFSNLPEVYTILK